jgi:hypothetical protein
MLPKGVVVASLFRTGERIAELTHPSIQTGGEMPCFGMHSPLSP